MIKLFKFLKNRFFFFSLLIISLCFIGEIGEAAKLKIRVIVQRANIRLKPDISSPVIAKAPIGTALESEGKEGKWFKVNLPPDESGFVVSGYIHESIVEIVEEIKEVPKEEKLPEVTLPEAVTEKEKEVKEKPEEKEIRVQEPAYQEYQPSKGPGINFVVKLNGGMSYISGGDINANLEGINDYWFDAEYIDIQEGKFKPVHLGFDLGAEMTINFNVTPKVGIGFGLSYIQGSKKSTVEGTYPWWGEETFFSDTINIKVSAIPITLSLYFDLPVADTINVVANAGIGYYLGTANWDYSEDEENWQWKENWKSKSNALGFHGGLSLELDISKDMTFVIEGIGRYAKLKGLKGDFIWENIYEGSYYEGTTEDATFWYYEWHSSNTGKKYPTIWFDDEKPSGARISNVREAEINLSGFSIRAGIKIKFSIF